MLLHQLFLLVVIQPKGDDIFCNIENYIYCLITMKILFSVLSLTGKLNMLHSSLLWLFFACLYNAMSEHMTPYSNFVQSRFYFP